MVGDFPLDENPYAPPKSEGGPDSTAEVPCRFPLTEEVAFTAETYAQFYLLQQGCWPLVLRVLAGATAVPTAAAAVMILFYGRPFRDDAAPLLLLDSGNKLQAIKLYRRASGYGLAQAKKDVEEYMSARTGR